MTEATKNLTVSDKRSIEILNDVAEKTYETFKKVHDSTTGNLNYDKIDAEVKTGAVSIKAIMSKAHLSNAGQRVIENVKTKQLK